MKKLLFFILVLTLGILLGIGMSLFEEKTTKIEAKEEKVKKIEKHVTEEPKTVKTTEQTEAVIIKKSEVPNKQELENTVIALARKFILPIYSVVYDENNQVLNYRSFDELKYYYSQIADEAVYMVLLNTFFEERNGVLYLIPQETPLWFDETKAFELKIEKTGDMKLIQQTQSDLDGNVTLIIYFTRYEGIGWIIEKIEYQ